MKVGDLIRVSQHYGEVHPVGIVLRVVKEQENSRRHMWCLYMDGDYEVLEYDTDFEVLSESR